MFIQVALPGAALKRYALNKDEVVVGRSHQSDVILEGDQVSRLHCRLNYKDGKWRVADADSANGVFLDRGGRGAPFLARHDLLMDGDHLYIGRYKLLLTLSEKDIPVGTDGPPPPPAVATDGVETRLIQTGTLRNEVREWLMELERPKQPNPTADS